MKKPSGAGFKRLVKQPGRRRTKLTIKELKGMEPDKIFASGITLIEHPWFNDAKKTIEKDGKSTLVKWIAIRGGIHDWAIYHSLDANLEKADYLDGKEHLKASKEMIASCGAKLHNGDKIKKLVPCDEEAFGMYRF